MGIVELLNVPRCFTRKTFSPEAVIPLQKSDPQLITNNRGKKRTKTVILAGTQALKLEEQLKIKK